MTDIELHAYWRSASTHRVRIALNLKGLTVRERFVDLEKGEQSSPRFLALNPSGAIPVLVEGGYPPLSQSLAILEFIEEAYPSPPLLPKDLHERARVRSLAAMLATDTNPLLSRQVRGYLASVAGLDHEAIRAWSTHWLEVNLRAFETRVASDRQTGRFCHGDTPTLADVYLVSILFLARALDVHVDHIPTIERIAEHCARLEPFARAQPLLQEGAPSPADR